MPPPPQEQADSRPSVQPAPPRPDSPDLEPPSEPKRRRLRNKQPRPPAFTPPEVPQDAPRPDVMPDVPDDSPYVMPDVPEDTQPPEEDLPHPEEGDAVPEEDYDLPDAGRPEPPPDGGSPGDDDPPGGDPGGDEDFFQPDDDVARPQPGPGVREPDPMPDLDPDIKAAVRRAHFNLAHPSREAFVRLLRLGGAAREAVEYARLWTCPVCARSRAPTAPRPAAMPMAESFNDLVSLDIFTIKDIHSVAYEVLSLLDVATTYHVAVLLASELPEQRLRRSELLPGLAVLGWRTKGSGT